MLLLRSCHSVDVRAGLLVVLRFVNAVDFSCFVVLSHFMCSYPSGQVTVLQSHAMGVFSSGRSGLKRMHQTIHDVGKSVLHPFRLLCFFYHGIQAVRVHLYLPPHY